MIDNVFYIYIYYDQWNTPFYVGKGKGGRYKPILHIQKPAYNTLLKNKIMKLGISNIVIKILYKDLTEEQAFCLEEKYIAGFGRRDLGLGPLCNLTNGGDGISGHKDSRETKLKKSIALKGKKKPKEAIKKGVETRKNRGSYTQTKEKRRKNSEGNKGRPSEKKGIKLKPEHIEKIRQASLKKTHTKATKELISLKIKQHWIERRKNG